jgi:hypothetical protein
MGTTFLPAVAAIYLYDAGRQKSVDVLGPDCRTLAAVLFSFTSTCQRLGVEPWAYLHDVLTRLPATPAGQLGDLLPDHWRATRLAEGATPAGPATGRTAPATKPVS